MQNQQLSDVKGKELVAAGHALANAISMDTPLIEIAKMMAALATRLDCALVRGDAHKQDVITWEKSMMAAIGEDGVGSATKAIAELKAQRDALAAEVHNCRGFVADHLGPEAELQFSGLNTDFSDSYLNSVRADAIANALDASSNHCDTDCVMDACDCSYEIAEMRSAGAIALHDGLVAYANELRAGKDGE